MSEFEKARNYLQIALSSAAQSSDDYGVNQSGYYEIIAAIKALNKQIPTKPEYEGDGYDENGNLIYDMAKCPNCGNDDFEYDINNWGCQFCPDCGQALDWSDNE